MSAPAEGRSPKGVLACESRDRASGREFTSLEGTLVVFAAIYLALIPVSGMTAIRSFAFAMSSFLVLVVVCQSLRGHATPIAFPGVVIPIALAGIGVWSIASLAWSVRPAYTLGELRAELMWQSLTVLIFYVAAGVARAWPILTTSALASFAVSAMLALALPAVRGGGAGSWYGDAGFFSTHIVLLAPIALTLPERSPKRVAAFAAIALIVLALAAARGTHNRIVFIALATLFATAAGLAALRWRHALARAPTRWAIALVALTVALGALFIDAAREKAERDFPPQTTIGETLVADPRLPLWDVTAGYIRQRPWTGHGYGRAILAPELRAAMGARIYEHPHNVIASQWLQTGAIGAGLFALLVVGLLVRYAVFYRSDDDRLAFVGLVGIALIVGFVVKNVTDDFFYRSGAREFLALNALIVGYGMRLARGRADG
jgi:hypothetical protein